MLHLPYGWICRWATADRHGVTPGSVLVGVVAVELRAAVAFAQRTRAALVMATALVMALVEWASALFA